MIECSCNYSKTSGSLCLFNKDEPDLDSNGNVADFKYVSFKIWFVWI